MNDILTAIEQRRSCRRYKPELPPKEDIEAVIRAGLYAASGMNRQSPIILAVTDPELRNAMSRDNAAVMGRDGDPFYGAPCVLVVLADKSNPNGVYDATLVMGNLMLAAHSLGLGSCWINRAKEVFETEKWQSFLREKGIEGQWQGVGNCIVGYPDVELPAPPERKPNRVFWME